MQRQCDTVKIDSVKPAIVHRQDYPVIPASRVEAIADALYQQVSESWGSGAMSAPHKLHISLIARQLLDLVMDARETYEGGSRE